MSATKFPRADAIAVAAELVRILRPLTERIIIAGSLRRRRPEVGDVEILFIPKFATERDGLFETKQVDLAEKLIWSLICPPRGVAPLLPRLSVHGVQALGSKNKLTVHRASGIPVDLFTATQANWFNYLVCRTGGAENNTAIAARAQEKGWKWHPYGSGFDDQYGRAVPVNSERDVFDLVGLPYREPWERL